jgi:hypothetical protein
MRDYAIVWLGVRIPVRGARALAQILDGSHDQVRRAHQHDLGTYVDTFGWTDDGEERRFLLVGKNLGMLGFKEGKTDFTAPISRLGPLRESVQGKLSSAGIRGSAVLHFLFHVEDQP